MGSTQQGKSLTAPFKPSGRLQNSIGLKRTLLWWDLGRTEGSQKEVLKAEPPTNSPSTVSQGHADSVVLVWGNRCDRDEVLSAVWMLPEEFLLFNQGWFNQKCMHFIGPVPFHVAVLTAMRKFPLSKIFDCKVAELQQVGELCSWCAVAYKMWVQAGVQPRVQTFFFLDESWNHQIPCKRYRISNMRCLAHRRTKWPGS